MQEFKIYVNTEHSVLYLHVFRIFQTCRNITSVQEEIQWIKNGFTFFDVCNANKQKHPPEVIAAPELTADNFLPMLHKTNLHLLQTYVVVFR